jgi:hypothetical protein
MIRDECGLEAWSPAQDEALCAAMAQYAAANPPPPLSPETRLFRARREANRIAEQLLQAQWALTHAEREAAKEARMGFAPPRTGCGLVFEAQRRLAALQRELAGAQAAEREALAATQQMERAA